MKHEKFENKTHRKIMINSTHIVNSTTEPYPRLKVVYSITLDISRFSHSD